ncbi:MAG: hypothetical protein GX121_03860 [Ignavibacteria bacterium]|nr:hypothetical protein [Ignavibacteria bacterium]
MLKLYKYLIVIFLLSFSQLELCSFYFAENIGQLKNQNNAYNNEVLYYFSSNNFKLHIKQNSISYELYNVISETDSVFDYKKIRNKYYTEKPLKNNQFTKRTIQFARIDLELVGANPATIETVNSQNSEPEQIMYSVLNNEYVKVPRYSEILYKNIYDNIDLKLFFNREGKPKYDFIVHPGGNPSDIVIKVNGADNLAFNKNDKTLSFSTYLGSVQEHIPLAYTKDNYTSKLRTRVEGNFKRISENTFGFSIKHYDNSKCLIIDPQIFWGTYLGGEDMDFIYGLASDNEGNVYAAGETMSLNNIASQGACQGEIAGFIDAFIRKFDKNGQVIWSTYFGGEEHDSAYGITCDSDGNVLIAGYTMSENGIASTNVWQENNNGGYGDAFIAKFSSEGEFLLGTYFGGTDYDCANGIACDNLNNIIITGFTNSSDFISTPNSFLTDYQNYGDAYLAKFNPSLELVWSTYFGYEDYDSGASVGVDSLNNIFVAGQTNSYMNISSEGAFQEEFGGFSDGFLAKFNSDGDRIWTSYYGGELDDACNSVKVDNNNDVLIAGYTNSVLDIASEGAFQNSMAGFEDGFVAKFSNTGERLWGTYYGGSNYDGIYSVCNNKDNELFISGFTLSQNNISTPSVHQENLAGYGFNTDGFVAKFSSAGERLWGTYYGGDFDEFVYCGASDADDNIVIAGNTESNNGISFNYSSQSALANNSIDGFVAKFFNNPQSFDTLNIQLQSGWNSISSNVIPMNEAIDAVFFSLKGTNIVVKNFAGSIYKPAENINEIGTWNNSEAYQVFLNAPAELSFVGKKIDQTQFVLHLNEGWNFIPYLRDDLMNAVQAFSSIIDLIVLVKDNEGKVYFPAYFLNDIAGLATGRGYYLFLTNPVDFYYP